MYQGEGGQHVQRPCPVSLLGVSGTSKEASAAGTEWMREKERDGMREVPIGHFLKGLVGWGMKKHCLLKGK